MKYAHRSAGFILFDKDNKIILQHRDAEAPQFALYWSLFGGGIEEGETPEEAVRREAQEELQIKLYDLKLFKRHEYKEKSGLREEFVFVSPLRNTVEELKKKQTEGDTLGLFSFEEINKLKVIPRDLEPINEFFSKN